MKGRPALSFSKNAEADSAESASRPAVETHRRDVAPLKAFVAIVVNLMLAAACAAMVVFILALPPS
jgi:sorbitol-specific phosphotransferase system component IIBC